uniref:DUF1618 domain-containing protein n=1 Tax=Oryza glumipatula TaxID=40148 RepID=A0A0E0BU51_9ORYZ
MEARRPKGRRSPPDLVHGWIILDRFVHSSDGDVDADDDVTASEIALTCSGRRVRASLRVADPPAVSRLRIHRLDADQPWPDAYILRHAQVVAAHRGSILFWARVPFADDEFVVPGYFPVDYFVYTAGGAAASSPPSLTRLPPCFIGGAAPDDEDHYFKPYRKQHQRIMLDENVGFLTGDGDGEFTVADITIVDCTSLHLCILNHHERSPSPVQWRMHRLEMQRKKQMRRKLSKWVNDVVLPCRTAATCASSTTTCSSTRRSCDTSGGRPRSSSMCLGNLRRVDNARLHIQWQRQKEEQVCTSCNFHLIDIHKCIWLHDFTMEADEFWRICARENELRLPLVTPSFPVVSLVDLHAISFLLKDGENGLYWLVEVDMRNKAMISPAALYINEEEEEGRCCGDNEIWKPFDGHYFIPSWFTSYLHEDPIQRFDMHVLRLFVPYAFTTSEEHS